MKFAIKYYKGCRVLDKADEVIIKYYERSANLINFAENLPKEQRLIVNIVELENIDDSLSIFKATKKAHPQFAILLSKEQSYATIAEIDVPFFFIEGASSYDDLAGITRLGVSDIYIMNELGFDIKNAADFCHSQNINVRVYSNVAQTASKFNVTTITQFFVRPDAVKLYESYIDVLEFYGPIDLQPVLYDIYRDERWLGALEDIIMGLNEEIDNQTIVPYFDISRLECRKRCAIGKCNICSAAEAFGKTLVEKKVGIKRKKAKHSEENDKFRVDEEYLSAESIAAQTDIGELFAEEVPESNLEE